MIDMIVISSYKYPLFMGRKKKKEKEKETPTLKDYNFPSIF